MENNESSADINPQEGCIDCGNPIIVPGYKNRLCKECRERFIKYPVPLYIRLFAVVVLAVLVLSMTRLSKNLSAGVHLKRGKMAEKRSNYLTAQREYEKVIKLIPGLLEAKCHLLLSSFYNEDFETLSNTSNELQGKTIEDNHLFNEMSRVIEEASEYFPSDSFNQVIEEYHSPDSIPYNIYKEYIQSNPTESFPVLRYVSLLFDDKQYVICDSLLNMAIGQKKGELAVLSLKPAVKRELGQLDSAMYYSDQLLVINHENVYGLSSKARTLLKLKKDDAGLELALKAHQLDNKEPYTLATMALAYHLMNRTAERDKLIERISSDSVVNTYMKYVKDVMAGKEKFR